MQSEMRLSDDGYVTDSPSPTISPTKESPNTKLINKESREFRTKYFTEKVLNNSANGVIYQGFRITDNFPVAIKQVPRTKINKMVKVGDRLIPIEFYLHQKASKCEGVVQVLDWYERRTSFVLVMEKPQNSIDLFEFSRTFGAIKEEPARIIMKQIVNHCLELRKKSKILHRDLKDENILINTADLSVKIIDFGCACDYKQDYGYSTIAGTPEFFPPEMLKMQKYRADKLNAWSIGILVYILVMGDVPFDNSKMIVKLKRTKYSEEHLTPQCVALLNGCLTDEFTRLSMDQVLNSEWLSNTH